MGASMGSLGGAAYQVLLQSKLVITALMVWYMKGEKQAPLQWNILVLIMLSMCCYMMGGSSDSGGGDGGIPVMGVVNVLLKVTVSCLCAVLADKYMKDYKSLPFYVQLTQMKVAWTLVILMISFTDGKTGRRASSRAGPRPCGECSLPSPSSAGAPWPSCRCWTPCSRTSGRPPPCSSSTS